MLPKKDTTKEMKMDLKKQEDHENGIKETHDIEEEKKAISEGGKETELNGEDGNKGLKEDDGTTRNQLESKEREKRKDNCTVQVNIKMEHFVT